MVEQILHHILVAMALSKFDRSEQEVADTIHVGVQVFDEVLDHILLQNKANMHTRDRRGETALDQTVKSRDTATVRMLLDAGAEISRSTLELTKKMGHQENLELLQHRF